LNKQQQRSIETRNRLLAAAEQCFARNGYDESGVALICQTAGVSKGAFYHHFDSKQALFLILLNRWLAGLDSQLTALEQDRNNGPDRLLAMSGIVGHLLQTPKEQLLIYLEYLNKAARDPQVWQATIEPYHLYRDQVAALISGGIDEGSLRPVKAEATANIMIALVIGILIQGYLDPDGADWNEVAEEGIGLLIQGVRS
jgi:AcrR family transcriptional regulator